MRRAMTVLVIIGVVGLATSGLASAKKGDQKIANKAVLTIDDVPEDLVEAPPAEDVGDNPAYPCGGELEEAFLTAVAAPANASSTFVLDESLEGYAVFFSEVDVLAKRSQAKAIERALKDDDAVRTCMETELEKFFALPNGETNVTSALYPPELDDKGNKGAIKGGDVFAGYHATIARSTPGGQPEFFEANIVFGTVGRAFLQFRVLTAGVANVQEGQELVQLMVKRLKRAR